MHWADLNLQQCRRMTKVSLRMSLDTSMDTPDFDLDGLHGQRNRALITFLSQLPPSIEQLELHVPVLNMARGDAYKDLLTINWDTVGHIVKYLNELSRIRIRLHSSYAEVPSPTWTDGLWPALMHCFEDTFPDITGTYVVQHEHPGANLHRADRTKHSHVGLHKDRRWAYHQIKQWGYRRYAITEQRRRAGKPTGARSVGGGKTAREIRTRL